jgi:hypothetical protein
MDGQPVGVWTGGHDTGQPLRVDFLAAASPAAVQVLVRRLAFHIAGVGNRAARTLRMQLADGAGNSSPLVVLPLELNLRPVAGADTLVTAVDVPVTTSPARLLANDADPDGDALLLNDLPVTTATGGTLTWTEGELTYSPPAGFAGIDFFDCTVEDARGGRTAHRVILRVLVGLALAIDRLAQLDPAAAEAGNHVVLHLAGVPGHAYRLQTSANFTAWEELATVNVEPDGLARFIDTESNQRWLRFFRAVPAFLPAGE